MTSTFLTPTGSLASRDVTISRSALARGMVSLGIATSGIVFTEPAPVDLVMLAVIGLLPLAGLQVYSKALVGYLLLWFACGAGAVIATMESTDWVRSLTHTGVSFYLYVLSFVLAAFVAYRPHDHISLIFRAWVVAALLAAIAGMIGYFNLLPGAFDLFTKFGRATGTFKDPNVLGPFLAPAILYCLHLVITGTWSQARLPLVIAGVLSMALLLSFSRGAWINFAVAVAVYGYVAFVLAPNSAARFRMIVLGGLGLAALASVVVVALQFESVSQLMAERSSLSQGYDLGPEGRFGGHEKAKRLILDSPLGLGATQFGSLYHHEDVHNVYLSMFLNAGWLGGVLYSLVVVMTLILGLRHLMFATSYRPLFVIAFAALIGNVVEGVVIDTDHWRHFYILLAIVWGAMCAPASSDRAEGR